MVKFAFTLLTHAYTTGKVASSIRGNIPYCCSSSFDWETSFESKLVEWTDLAENSIAK